MSICARPVGVCMVWFGVAGAYLRPQQVLMGALAHPLLVELNVERSIFAAQLFQEGQARPGLRSRSFCASIRLPLYKLDSHIGRLHTRTITEKIAKRYSCGDFKWRFKILTRRRDAFLQTG